MSEQRAGFIAVIGKPNAGKSSLLNWLADEKIALVSKKANATRKRANVIVMHGSVQFIFIDTPGIHESEKLLNKFMLEETLKAMGDADLILFLSPATDSLQSYKDFLSKNPKTPHVVLLTKCDKIANSQLLKKLSEFEPYKSFFQTIIPISIKHKSAKNYLLDELQKFIPEHPYFYDPEIISTQMMKEIYAEYVREAVFEFVSDEVPYSSHVIIDKIEESEKLDKIYANIIVEKESQKNILIGESGKTIKKIGIYSRKNIEKLTNRKIFIKISVNCSKKWTKNEKILTKLGFYE
ncbi:MAG: GTPase Era [Campylobacteraceae bacterium]|nr:GTPase Era [Campylobacteraceae bacterium]